MVKAYHLAEGLLAAFVVLAAASASLATTNNLPDNLVFRSTASGSEDSWSVLENDTPSGQAPGDGVVDRNGTYGLQGPGEIAHLADINGDGLDDMINVWEGAGFWRYGVRYTESNGDLGTGAPVEAANFDLATDTIDFGDLDNDGIDDILAKREGFFNIEWFARLSSGTPGFADAPVVSNNWGDLALGDVGIAADVNGDGAVDRLLSRPTGGGFEVFSDYSTGAGQWGDGVAEPVTWIGGNATTDYITAADLNGDGLDDIVLVRDDDSDGLGVGTYEFFGYFSDASGISDGTTVDVTFSVGDIATSVPLFGQVETDAVENADFDEDGDVDIADVLVLQRGFGVGTTLSEGDANDNGAVDSDDLTIWENQVGIGSAVAASAVRVVPEPFCGSLAAAALLVLAASPRRRSLG